MNRLLSVSICAALLLVLSAPGQAAPACTTENPLNYQQLMSLGAGGCTIQNILFSNFQFAGSSSGSGSTPVASQLSFTFDNPGMGPNGSQLWGFLFNPNLAVSNVGSEDIQIQYDITAPSNIITSIDLALMAPVVGGGATLGVGESDCGGVVGQQGCTLLPSLQVTGNSAAAFLTGLGPFATVHVFKDMNVNSTVTGGYAVLSIVRDSVDTTTVPEPTTLAYLFGGGLLLLGKAVRRTSR